MKRILSPIFALFSPMQSGRLRLGVWQIILIGALFGSSLVGTPVAAVGAAPLLATITVNTTVDEAGTGAGCSLREAITAANTNAAFGGCPAGSPGADTILLPAGTYTLTITNTGTAGANNEDGNARGDLDILESLTLQGAGAGSTIIQAGTTNANGIDKVIAANPLCTPGVNVTIDGVTVRYGRNTQAFGASDFSYSGAGIDWCAGASGKAFTLSNSVLSDNTNVNAYGAGLNIDSKAGPYTANITHVTFQNNITLSTTNEANSGAINIFGVAPIVNITGSTFINNSTTNPNSAGGAVYYRPTTLGSLNINNSTFDHNTAVGSGGAIATSTYETGSSLTLQNSDITNNHATNSFGGGLWLAANVLNTTPFQLTNLLISGNTAGLHGGGLYVGMANMTLANSRVVNNTATTGNGLYKSIDPSSATVTHNWWGCSTGPSAAPCDRAITGGGTLNFTPWLRDKLSASPSALVTNQTTALTASYLTNSAGAAVPLANLAQLIGQPVTWAASGGALSAQQATIQASGTAAATFTASAAGSAVISARVDNDNTAGASSNILNLTVSKAATTTVIATHTSNPSAPGQPVAVSVTETGQYGNAPTAPTGTITISSGAVTCSITLPATTCALTFTSPGLKTLSASYPGDGNFAASLASAPHLVNIHIHIPFINR